MSVLINRKRKRHSDAPSPPPTPVITVDSFLQASGATPAKKTRVDLSASNHARLFRRKRPARALVPSSPSPSPPPKKPKVKSTRPFSVRLLEAALSCQVDPASFLKDQDPTLSRLPLKFDVVRPPVVVKRPRRSYSLVDPRKAQPFPDSRPRENENRTFSRTNSINLNLGPLPVPPTSNDVSRHKTKVPGQRVRLEFVPIPNTHLDDIRKKRQPDHQSLSSRPVSQTVTDRKLHTPTNAGSCSLTSPDAQPSPDADVSGPLETVSIPSAPLSAKPLKPLASFFDEFFETVRTATQLASQYQPSSKFRLRSKLSNNPIETTTTPTLKSFFQMRRKLSEVPAKHANPPLDLSVALQPQSSLVHLRDSPPRWPEEEPEENEW